MRDVGQQLSACRVGRLERPRPAGQFQCHLVERSRESGDFVAAVVGCTSVQIARSQSFCGLLHGLQTPTCGAEDYECDHHHPDAQHPRRHRCHRRTEPRQDPPERRASGQDHDPADRHTGEEDRREFPAPGWRAPRWRRTISIARSRFTVGWRSRTVAPTTESARSVIHELLLFANRFEQRRRHVIVIRERSSVPHDDDEGLERLTVLLGKILLKIQAWVRIHRRADVGGDERRKPARRPGRHRPGDPISHPEKERALGRQHQREECEESQRDAPVQAAVPKRPRHQRPYIRPPTLSG